MCVKRVRSRGWERVYAATAKCVAGHEKRLARGDETASKRAGKGGGGGSVHYEAVGWVDSDGFLRDASAKTGYRGVSACNVASTFQVRWSRYLGCFATARAAAKAVAREAGHSGLLAEAQRMSVGCLSAPMTANQAQTTGEAQSVALQKCPGVASGYRGVYATGRSRRPWFALTPHSGSRIKRYW